MPLRHTAPLRHLGALLLALGLGACGLNAPNDRTTVTLNVASPGTQGLVTRAAPPSERQRLLAALIREAQAEAFANHPNLAYLALLVEAGGFGTEQINQDYNEGRFTRMRFEGQSQLLLEGETTHLTVPNSVTVTFTVSAYTREGYRLFRQRASLSRDELGANSPRLALDLQVDIDPRIPLLASDTQCSGDDDGDGLCNDYEQLFYPAGDGTQLADIDLDGIPNSADSDSDGDGIGDAAEGAEPSNAGFPLFVHRNRPPQLDTGLTLSAYREQPTHLSFNAASDPDLGDTATLSYALTQAPSHGTAWFDGQSLYYQGAQGYLGSDAFSFSARDRWGAEAVAEVSVGVAEVPAPITRDDRYSGSEDTPILAMALLANDYSPIGLPLSFQYLPTTTTAGGQLSLNSDGTVDYTPPAEYQGEDSFSYSVTDGVAREGYPSAQVTLTLAARNDAPVVISESFTTRSDSLLNASGLLNNDSDADGDALSISAMQSRSAQGGVVTRVGDDGFTYQPPHGFEGTDGFYYIVTDGSATTTGSVTIQVVAGIAANDSYTTDALTPLTRLDFLANDESPSGSLELSAVDTQATLGLLRDLSDGPAYLRFDYLPNGAFDYLGEGQTATDRFTYTVYDPVNAISDSATVTITLTGVNDAPQLATGASADLDLSAYAGRPLVLPDLTAWVSDPDQGDTLYLIGVPTTTPLGADLAQDGKQLTYTAPSGVLGSDSFTVTVADRSDAQSGVTFTLNLQVVEAPPATWLGTQSSDWASALNWSGGSVPGTHETVTIPPGTPYPPTLGQAATLQGLFVAADATLQLNADLTITGSLMVDGSLTLGDTTPGVHLDGDVSLSGQLPALIFDSGATAQGGVTGDLSCLGGELRVRGGSSLTVAGNLQLGDPSGACGLQMLEAETLLLVEGSLTLLGGSHTLNAGELRLTGDLTALGAADISGRAAHTTRLIGRTAQTLDLALASPSTLGTLGVENDGLLTLASDLTLNGTLQSPLQSLTLDSATPRHLISQGVVLSSATFASVSLETHGITQLDNITFTRQDPSSTQLTLHLEGVTATLANLRFETLPRDGGLYLQGIGASEVTMVGAMPGYGLPLTLVADGFTLNWGSGTEESDGDGLSDADELTRYLTNPVQLDTDGDLLDDGLEVTYGSDPLDPSSSPLGASVTPGLLLDFEADDGGLWSPGTLWQHGVPSSGPGAAHSGTQVWATNLSGDYGASQTEYLYLPPLDLTTAAAPTLSLNLWATAWGGGDATHLEAFDSTTGQWQSLPAEIAPYDGSDAVGSAAWAAQSYHGSYVYAAASLAPFAGRAVLVRLVFRSNSSLNAAGFYFDDLRLNDETQDIDSDGLPGVLSEFHQAGTSPILADSDGDGSLDGNDPLPLNPAHYPGAAAHSVTHGVFDFETGDGGLRSLGRDWGGIWARPSLWAHGTPTSGPAKAFSGSQVWATNLTGNYFANAREALYLPPLDLTTASNPTLSLRLWANAWGGGDATSVEVFDTDTSTWLALPATIAAYDGSNALGQAGWAFQGYHGGYVLAALSLADYVGAGALQVRLNFTSNSSLEGAGFYLDELRLDDEGGDPDGDGQPGVITEFDTLATDPFVADSDGDGSQDRVDPWPLNPAAYPGAAHLTSGSRLDFEADDGGLRSLGRAWGGIWAAPTLWQHGTPTSGPVSAYDGTQVWATNLTGNYFSDAREALYLPLLDLGTSLAPTLSVRLWANAWGGGDAARFEYYDDAQQAWIGLDAEIAAYDGTDGVGNSGWAFQGYQTNYVLGALSLVGLTGQSDLQLRLTYYSNSSLEGAGVYLDELHIDEENNDPDGDGSSGVITEYLTLGSDPFNNDTDADGSPDGSDNAPLNPAVYPTATALVAGSQLDFENDDGGLRSLGRSWDGIWSLGALWQYGVPSAVAAYQGERVWATNLGGNYFASAIEALYLPPLDLSNLGDPTLSLRIWANAWGGGDGTRFEVYDTLSGNWLGLPASIATYDGSDAAGNSAWAFQGYRGHYALGAVTLKAYAGQSGVQTRLMFRSNSSLEAAGAYIDLLRLDDEGDDADVDGATGVIQEYTALGTDPFVADTDGDGDPDSSDPAPLNPAYRSDTTAVTLATLFDFEADDGGLRSLGPVGAGLWPAGTLWAHGTPTNGPAIAYSGTQAWATQLSGNYFANAREYLYLPPIDLRSATAPVVTLQIWANSWGSGDGTRLEVLDPVSGTWLGVTPVQTPYDGTDALGNPAWAFVNTGYQQTALPLDAYIGVTRLQLRLAFRANNSLEAQGFYFDELAIEP